jgi:hypothetical protein
VLSGGCGGEESFAGPDTVNAAGSNGGQGSNGTGSAGQNGVSGPDDAAAPNASADELFDEDHVLDVQIELAQADWDALRFEGRDLSALAGDCVAGPPADLYNTYSANVIVDGQRVDNVALRKKGFLGSISQVRPSLKIDFDEFVATQTLRGTTRLTLNNNKQDTALIRQCLVYRTFAAAGVPAPRCNFARVTVNGADLGVYSHVEEIKKPFLRRHFADDSGNLYEGQRSDFNDVLVATFEAKTNEATNDRSDLSTIVTALNDDSLSDLEALVDVDRFLTFWAMEVLTGHWDGYASNRNNFYLYADPTSGKMHFLPWGPDIGFSPNDPFHALRAASVSADGRLASKLYEWPETKAAYLVRMQEVLDTVWQEDELLAEVARMAELLGTADEQGLSEIRDYITTRQAAIEEELGLGGGLWSAPAEDGYCLQEVGSVSATFNTDWGSLSSTLQHTHGTATLDLVLAGESQTFTAVGAVAGPDETSGNPVIRVVGANLGNAMAPQIQVEPGMWRPGAAIPYHGFATFGMVFTFDGLTLGTAGFMGAGSLTLDDASSTSGGLVSGHFSGSIYWRPAR